MLVLTTLPEQSATHAAAGAATATAATAGAIHQSQGAPAHAVPAYQEAIDLYTDELQLQLEIAEANGYGESLFDVGGESSEENDPAKTQTVAAIQHFQQTLALLHYRVGQCLTALPDDSCEEGPCSEHAVLQFEQ
jgi:hypothetical protein